MITAMYQRQISDEMNVCMQEFPAIAILGPRQVGKTTLAHQLMQQRTLALAGQGTAGADGVATG